MAVTYGGHNKSVTVSLLRWPPGSRGGLKNPLGLLEAPDIIVFQGKAETMGVVIEICMCKCKTPGGHTVNGSIISQ
jgi:hypothetical protein